MASLSVVIPAYNAERWLPETLESVASQDWPNLEVIVVDDGSTDGTAALVTNRWPAIRLIRTENKGVSHARNAGMAAATGELIQFLDADDLLSPGKLARHAKMLCGNHNADAVYSNWQRLTEGKDGTFAAAETVERTLDDVHPDPQVAFFSSLWCPTGAYLYRRAFLQASSVQWSPALPVIQDVRFVIDCARAGARWLHDPEISVLYRQHQGGSISTR
ncbi:MAG: glycosyl transferase family 2, partial [Verrucomicrobiaceae bacterium]|nr:glycosyl transferase family 2 [Verrucomicrobiaceae bacterium]